MTRSRPRDTDNEEGDRRLLLPDALCKCDPCGATIKTLLDYRLHTHGTGRCIVDESGQKDRRSPLDNL